MTAEYQALRQRAEAAYNHLKDAVSDKAAAGGCIENAHLVMDDCDASRNPRSIEDRIKQIIQSLKGISHTGSPAMPADRAVAMTRLFEDLQMQVKRMPNY
jgi:hypothetical protein